MTSAITMNTVGWLWSYHSACYNNRQRREYGRSVGLSLPTDRD